MLLNVLFFIIAMGISFIAAIGIHRWWEVVMDLVSVLASVFTGLWLITALVSNLLGGLKLSYTTPED